MQIHLRSKVIFAFFILDISLPTETAAKPAFFEAKNGKAFEKQL